MTDGLSDPFAPDDQVGGLEEFSGFGVELWAETDEVGSEQDVTATFAFALVSAMSYQVADLAIDRLRLDKHDVMSMELLAGDVTNRTWPRNMVTREGKIGVLLGVRAPSRPQHMRIADTDIRCVSIRLLDAQQLEVVRLGGAAARAQLRDELERAPGGWISKIAAR